MSAAFDAYFGSFLRRTLHTPRLAGPAQAPDGSTFDEAVEQSWLNQTRALRKRMSRRGRLRQMRDGLAIAEAVRTIAPEVMPATFHDFVARRLQITPVPQLGNAEADIFYIKVNHGFWEQIYSIFADEAAAVRKRTTSSGALAAVYSRKLYAANYVHSGFTAALRMLIRAAANDDGRVVRLDPVYFAASLSNGDRNHQDLLDEFAFTPDRQPIRLGAAIGLTAFMQSIFGPRQFCFWDGAFPKLGLQTGELRACLQGLAGVSERIIFVVPPHLSGVELADVRLPQEHVFVSGKKVHQSWAGSLHACARRIFECLETNDRVIVITQSAVFSALLGLFLQQAKAALCPAEKRIYFFDLGQVLDIANPTDGGGWVTRVDLADATLFRLARGAH